MVLRYANQNTARTSIDAIGRHLLIEMKGCTNLNDKDVIREMLKVLLIERKGCYRDTVGG